MACHNLAVDVLRAEFDKLTPDYCCVVVSFGEQRFTTLTTGSRPRLPVWNSRFKFSIPDILDERHTRKLKAEVYQEREREPKELLGAGEESIPHSPGSVEKFVSLSAKTTGIGRLLIIMHVKLFNPLETFSGQRSTSTSSSNIAAAAADPLPCWTEADGGESAAALHPAADHVPQEIRPCFKRGAVTEEMRFLFVRVVRAHDLPDINANGSLDPFVEVRFHGLRGVTTHLVKNKNPVWNTTFAFSLMDMNANVARAREADISYVHLTVMDKDAVKDECVGVLPVPLAGIPVRSPHDHMISLEPTRHPLHPPSTSSVMPAAIIPTDNGSTIGQDYKPPHLTVAIWIGSQLDEAYHDAAIILDNIPSVQGDNMTRAKVYETKRLWYLRVTVIEVNGECIPIEEDATDVIDTEDNTLLIEAKLGEQKLSTSAVKKRMAATGVGGIDIYVWKENLFFVVDLPLPVDDPLIISAIARVGGDACKEKTTGHLQIEPWILQRVADDGGEVTSPAWFRFEKPGQQYRHSRHPTTVSLVWSLEGRYHVPCGGYHSGYWSTDGTRATDGQITWKPPVGSIDLGILRATGLGPLLQTTPTEQDMMTSSSSSSSRAALTSCNPYCVARYGGRWLRTRTVVNSIHPVFNEQYTWKVYDVATVLTVGVFNNKYCKLQQLKGAKDTAEDDKLGKVRIRLSGLQTGRVYTHSYPLSILHGSGVRRTGELVLAVRFTLSSTSIANVVRAYSCPALPNLHYTHPLPPWKLLDLQHHAIQLLSTQLSQAEEPLKKEVVQYMCGAGEGSDIWSVRKWRANFHRIAALLSFARWFQDVCSWRDPVATLIVHTIFVLALWFHHLVLPSLLMSFVITTVWNYPKLLPTCPCYIDLKLSLVDAVTPDQLEEEFDIHVRTACSPEVVAARYDRMRIMGGRVQMSASDLASYGERIHGLVTWTDPRATAIFELFALLSAIVAYFVPCKVLVAAAGFYIMRHPILRRQLGPPAALCLLQRLPSKADMFL